MERQYELWVGRDLDLDGESRPTRRHNSDIGLDRLKKATEEIRYDSW